MADPFLGQITMFAGNYAPTGWAFCDGELLPIAGNDALFSLIGTIYGGNGSTNFGLPDMRGRVPIHYGTGTGLTSKDIGSMGGVETVALTVNQIPPHNHLQQASTNDATSTSPDGLIISKTQSNFYENTATQPSQFKTLNASAVSITGENQPHNNMAPFLCINFIIAISGTYPMRSY